MATTARCDMVTRNAKRTHEAALHGTNTVRLCHNRMTCHLVTCAHQIFLFYQHFTVVLPLWWEEAGQAEGTTVQQARGRTVQAACFHSDPGRIKLH